MKNIVIYGGAFNPPTNAHLAITKACIEKARQLDAEFWLLPSGSRKDKSIESGPNLRLSYLGAFLDALNEGEVKIHVELSEFNSKEFSRTADTVERLSSDFPKVRFFWAFGADSISTMKNWHNGTKLFNELDMLVIPRAGYEITAMPPKAQIIKVDVPIVSSSQVRELIQKGDKVHEVVPMQVAKIIHSNFS